MSLYGMTVGRDVKFRNALDKAGFDVELANAIIDNPRLAETLVGWLREQLSPLSVDSWTPVSEYKGRLVARALERKWPLSRRIMEPLNELESITHAGALQPVSVEVWLGDLATTYEELWLWVVEEVTKLDSDYLSWRWDEELFGQKLSGSDNLRFLPVAPSLLDPKMTPVGLDLETHWDRTKGVRPCDVRTPVTAAGLELFTLLALNPQLVPRMGDDLPHLWVPRLQVTLPGEDTWTGVPILSWLSVHSTVSLNAYWNKDHFWQYTIPVRRDLSTG